MATLAELDRRILATLEAPNPDQALIEALPDCTPYERVDLVRQALQGRLDKVSADAVAKGWCQRVRGRQLPDDAARPASRGQWRLGGMVQGSPGDAARLRPARRTLEHRKEHDDERTDRDGAWQHV